MIHAIRAERGRKSVSEDVITGVGTAIVEGSQGITATAVLAAPGG